MNYRGVSGFGRYVCPVCRRASFNFCLALNQHVRQCKRSYSSQQNPKNSILLNSNDGFVDENEDNYEILYPKKSLSNSKNKSSSNFNESISSSNNKLSTIHSNSSSTFNRSPNNFIDQSQNHDEFGHDDMNLDISSPDGNNNNVSTSDVLYLFCNALVKPAILLMDNELSVITSCFAGYCR